MRITALAVELVSYRGWFQNTEPARNHAGEERSNFLNSHPPSHLKSAINRHILFLCSQNRLRSPTAEAVFADHPGVEVDSAGLNNDAIVPVSAEQIEWADLIVVMETAHRERLNRKFRDSLAGKRIAVLNIPDNYDYMDTELVRLLKARCAPYLP